MQKQNHQGHVATDDHFPTDTAGLVEAVGSEVVDLADGDEVDLRIAPVTKRIGDATVRMLAYNGSIPGPTLRVREGSELVVNVANEATSRQRCTGTGCASTTATTARTRRRRRFRSAERSRTGSSFPIRASTGITRTFARTTARRWVCTGTSLSFRPILTTGRRRIASCC